MAEIIKNEKGFKVIKMTTSEMLNLWPGTIGICGRCNEASTTKDGLGGYYIAVLNEVYCEKDYLKWVKEATRYEEDKVFEERNFSQIKQRIKIDKNMNNKQTTTKPKERPIIQDNEDEIREVRGNTKGT